MQISFLTIIWIMLLTSFFQSQIKISLNFFWNLIVISILVGVIFGIIYPYIWNYTTSKASTNIIVCTCINVCMQIIIVILYSQQMWLIIKPYLLGIIILTLIGHIIAFYFYKSYQNKKTARLLNQLTRQQI